MRNHLQHEEKPPSLWLATAQLYAPGGQRVQRSCHAAAAGPYRYRMMGGLTKPLLFQSQAALIQLVSVHASPLQSPA